MRAGAARNARWVATPKFPPPPRRPQSRSASTATRADDAPVGRDELGARELSHVSPCCDVRCPCRHRARGGPGRPPTPRGVRALGLTVAMAQSSHVEPARAISASRSTSPRRMREVERVAVEHAVTGRVVASPRTATSSSLARAKPMRSRRGASEAADDKRRSRVDERVEAEARRRPRRGRHVTLERVA